MERKKICNVMGIDGSMRATGVSLGVIYEIDGEIVIDIEKIALIKTEKSKNKSIRASSDTISRCRHIRNNLFALIDVWKPAMIFAETPTGSQSASGMKNYGIVCMMLGSLPVPPIEVTPAEVKIAAVSDKQAKKREVIEWAYKLYPKLDWVFFKGKLQNSMEHPADAIGTIYAGVRTREFRQLLGTVQRVKGL